MNDISPPEPTLRERQRSRNLIMFYDDFVEFHCSCAFLCDAVTGMLQSNAEVDSETLEGIRAYSDQVKQAARDLKKKLDAIQEAASSDNR